MGGRKPGRSGRWLECCLSEPRDMVHPGPDRSDSGQIVHHQIVHHKKMLMSSSPNKSRRASWIQPGQRKIRSPGSRARCVVCANQCHKLRHRGLRRPSDVCNASRTARRFYPPLEVRGLARPECLARVHTVTRRLRYLLPDRHFLTALTVTFCSQVDLLGPSPRELATRISLVANAMLQQHWGGRVGVGGAGGRGTTGWYGGAPTEPLKASTYSQPIRLDAA